MPRPRTIDAFGPEYEQLLLRAEAGLRTAKEFTVQFESPNVAHSLRHSCYQYMKALRTSNKRPDLTAICADWSLRVAGSALVFYRRADAADARAIRAALHLPEGFADGRAIEGTIAAENALSSHLERLAEIRARKDE
jgi:hypothetical protein